MKYHLKKFCLVLLILKKNVFHIEYLKGMKSKSCLESASWKSINYKKKKIHIALFMEVCCDKDLFPDMSC